MNNKGFSFFIGIMLGLTIIILALALASPVKQFTDSARNETTILGGDGLNCTNTELSTYDQATCIATDSLLPYFIGFLIFMGLAIMTAKIIYG